MEKFRDKIFNEEVFEKYLDTLPSTKENSLIKNALFKVVNKYKASMGEQTGSYAVLTPIKGRLGGTPVNYDGDTDIPAGTERDTFFQRKVCYGRAMSWGEYDFSADITGENFMAEANEVKEYWDEQRQSTVLSILKGIFSMTGGVNGSFVDKHTYDISKDTAPTLSATSLNTAIQKALGDKKAKFDVIFMHSVVSTNLENLNLLNFLKYTDSEGIERDLTIGTFNGKLVIVDDEMPVNTVEAEYELTSDTAIDSTKTYYTRSGSASAGYTYTEVANPSVSAIGTYYEIIAEAYRTYVSYVFQNGFFEFENIGLENNKVIELARDAYTKGGKTDLISRVREMVVPYLISYTGTGTISPTNSNFESGSNWELANNDKTGENKVYIDDKLIPVARLISRG